MSNPKGKTKAGTPRLRAEGGGRKPSGKVKVTMHVLPETRAKMGAKPGEACDKKFAQ